MIVNKYQKHQYSIWNNFVKNSKQGTFLFNRDYMNYHADRFEDHSLMFYDEKNRLIAILPANIKDNMLYSHQGLSYGGLIYEKDTSVVDILNCFEILKNYAKDNNIRKLIYKRIPYIYHKYPADEDEYALFINNAKLSRKDIGFVIAFDNLIEISRNKKRYLRHFNEKHEIKESSDYKTFHDILSEALSIHNAKPIHNENELRFLTEKFPENISLYGVYFESKMLASCWVFKTQNVLHVQNMVATKFARENNFIDYCYNWIINHFKNDFKYLSFGISTEQDGRYLNEGLALQKENFGGRGICYDFYELEF